MSDSASSLARTIARQYDLFQASLEFLQKDRKFLNYGYTVSGMETCEERQQRLCLEVFQAAEIGQGDVVIDVGFGSGEQDFLLSNTCEFSRLVEFDRGYLSPYFVTDPERMEVVLEDPHILSIKRRSRA